MGRQAGHVGLLPSCGAGPALKENRFLFLFSSTMYELLCAAHVVLPLQALSFHSISYYSCYSRLSFEVCSLLPWVRGVMFVKLKNTTLPLDIM